MIRTTISKGEMYMCVCIYIYIHTYIYIMCTWVCRTNNLNHTQKWKRVQLFGIVTQSMPRFAGRFKKRTEEPVDIEWHSEVISYVAQTWIHYFIDKISKEWLTLIWLDFDKSEKLSLVWVSPSYKPSPTEVPRRSLGLRRCCQSDSLGKTVTNFLGKWSK